MYGMTFGSLGCATIAWYPTMSDVGSRLAGRVGRYQHGKVTQAMREMEDIFLEVKPKWFKLAYGLGPVIVGLAILIFFDNVILAFLGAGAAILLPDLWVRQAKAMRRRQFREQLVDALFLVSSSLRAGLSLSQALEAVESEMTPPISQEFGLVIRAHRVGVPLEEALEGLNRRMGSEELNLVITALLLARSTGGDVTKVVDQLVATIRERKKLHDKVYTLTLQGRLQAYIMSGLPLFFAMFVRTFNPRYFDPLLHDELGPMLIGGMVVLWVIGMILLFRLSRVEV